MDRTTAQQALDLELQSRGIAFALLDNVRSMAWRLESASARESELESRVVQVEKERDEALMRLEDRDQEIKRLKEAYYGLQSTINEVNGR